MGILRVHNRQISYFQVFGPLWLFLDSAFRELDEGVNIDKAISTGHYTMLPRTYERTFMINSGRRSLKRHLRALEATGRTTVITWYISMLGRLGWCEGCKQAHLCCPQVHALQQLNNGNALVLATVLEPFNLLMNALWGYFEFNIGRYCRF